MTVLYIVIAFVALLVAVICRHLWKWSRLPKPEMRPREILVSPSGTRVKLTRTKNSSIDGHPMYWLAVDDAGRYYPLPLDGAWWRLADYNDGDMPRVGCM